jgi:hypothetical protein
LWIYLKPISESNNFVPRNALLKSDLALKALKYKDPGFGYKPRREKRFSDEMREK